MSTSENTEKSYTIEFTTSCYENDWEMLLTTGRIQKMIEVCQHPFDVRKVYINNVSNYERVAESADRLIKQGIIDEFHRVADYEKEVLDFFNISNKNGFYYLIQFLTILYKSESDFLLNFTGDAMLTNNSPWIKDAIEELNKNDKVIVANALFDGQHHQAMRESFDDDENFYYSVGFSDQCFLVGPETLKKQIYEEVNAASDFFPPESRDSFEERVYRYMRNRQLYRITHKRAIYRHKNFPKNRLKKWAALNLGLNNKKYGIN